MKEDISDKDLLQWFSRGLIPGPQERDDAFLERVENSPALASEEAWKPVHQLTYRIFGIKVDFVPFIYSNEKLAFWEGAAFWLKENGQMLIQLRTLFKKGKFWIYDRTELLAHESIHAARLLFKEKKFEEILAYQTAQSCFRRMFGPLFFQPWESLFFMLTTALLLILQMVTSWPLLWGIVGMLSYYVNRLIWCRVVFARCVKKASLPVTLGLTDTEIELFSKFSTAEIQAHLEWEGSIRTKMLRAVFRSWFKPKNNS